MYEIVIVKACRYEKGDEVYAEPFMKKEEKHPNVLWWFDHPDTDLKEAILIASHNLALGNFKCEAIRFEFDFCPNPHATNFAVSALHDEVMYAHNTGDEKFTDGLPKLVEIVKQRLAEDTNPYRYIGLCNFYALYEVEIDKHYDDDGGTDSIDVWPTLVGELDFEKLPLAVVGQV
jgi:hypothetical protein